MRSTGTDEGTGTGGDIGTDDDTGGGTGGAREPAAVLRAIARSLAAEVPELAERQFAALDRRMPELRAEPEEFRDDVRAAVGRMLRLLLRALAAEPGPGRPAAGDPAGDGASWPAVVQAVRDLARHRAAAGQVTLQQSLLAYEIGAEELLSVIAARVPPDRSGYEAVTHAGRRLLKGLQLITSAVAQGYQDAAAAAAVESEQETTRYLEMLAGRRPVSPEAAGRMGRAGYAGPHAWCAVSAPLEEGAADLVRSVRLRQPGVLAGLLDGRLVALGPAPVAALPVPVGTTAVDGDTAEALRRAAAAADLAAHQGADRLDATANAMLSAVLAAPAAERRAYVRARLGGLPERPELLETLAAYLRAQGSVLAAARALGVHRHTLGHRLARIEEASGLDLRDPGARLAAELALFCLGRYP